MDLQKLQTRCALSAYRLRNRLTKKAKGILRRLAFKAPNKEAKNVMNNRLIAAAAKKLGLRVDTLPYDFLRISDGERAFFANDLDFSCESLTAYWLCGDKHLSSLLLQNAGIPVPEFSVFPTSELASAFIAFPALKLPVLVKPCLGSSNEGISAGVSTFREFCRACYHAALNADRIMVEGVVPGRQWRITMFDGELMFACERLAAFVVGDGQSTVAALVKKRNDSIAWRDGFPNAFPVQIDHDTHAALRTQNLTIGSAPEAGRKVILKRVCHAAAGGVTADVTDKLHPDYLELAQRAAQVMGAKLAGVDIIAPDITTPLDSGAVVSEVHTTPSFLLTHFDVSGNGNAIQAVTRLLSKMFSAPVYVSRTQPTNGSIIADQSLAEYCTQS